MGVLCFQASCLLLIIMSSFLPLPFPPMHVVPGPFSRSSSMLFSSDKNNWFYSAFTTKILGSTLPCHIKIHLKKTHFWFSHRAIYCLLLSAPETLSLLPLCAWKFSLRCFFWTPVSITFCLSSIQHISDHLSSALF